MDKEDFKQLKSTVKQWLFHTGQLDPTDYANELKLKFIEPREKRITELEAINKKISDECHKLVDSFEIKQNENVELIRKVAFLENDLNNAKAQIEKMKCCENCADFVEYATCAPMAGKPRFNESPLQKVKGCRLCGECKDKNLWRIKP